MAAARSRGPVSTLAVVCRTVDEPCRVEAIELAPLGPHDVRVRVAASGVCRSDLSVRDGTIPFPLPAVLGHEGAGVVEAVGGEVSRVAPGDHVVLSCMPACRRCPACLAGQPMLCDVGLAEVLGGPYATAAGQPLWRGLGVGCFAELAQLPERAVVPVDRAVPLDVAALVGCALATGTGAVWRTTRVRPGMSVAVIGCGGVGLAAVAGASLAGAGTVVAVDTVPAALDLARALGATDCVLAGGPDPAPVPDQVRSLTGGTGVDVAVEVVGRPATIRDAFAAARRGGTVVLVGAGSATDTVSFSPMELFVDAKTVIGCVYGSTDADRDFPFLVELVRRGTVNAAALVQRRVPLDGTDGALDLMAAGAPGRTLVVPGPAGHA